MHLFSRPVLSRGIARTGGIHRATRSVSALASTSNSTPLGHSPSLAMASISTIRHSDLHRSRPTWWLDSLFHFSFADWMTSDPERRSFGALRVVNDDVVQARAGFGTHPHRDMEIFSYVVDGQLSHADSMGNREALPRGCVQYMSAGTGVLHSEMNDGSEPTRFLQIWIRPDRAGHAPNYGSSTYTKADRHNKLLQILGGTSKAPAWKEATDLQSIKLHQDANVYVSESDQGKAFSVDLDAGRAAYLVCIEGSLDVNGTQLQRHDAAKIRAPRAEPAPITLTAGAGGAHFLLIELAQ